LESFSASFADTFSIRTVKVSSAWADIPAVKSSSVASTDILRVLCDMVGLFILEGCGRHPGIQITLQRPLAPVTSTLFGTTFF
jgi:hypothetical protein